MGNQGQTINNRVQQGADGKYRWIYEMSLWKNPTIFLMVWKIFFFIILGIFAFTAIVDIIDWGEVSGERLLDTLRIFGYFALGMTVLVAISYAIYALIMGGKYIVQFEMDESGINHRQIEAQAKKARKISAATVLIGLAAKRVTTVGVGLNSARSEMYSDFSKTRKVKAYRMRNLIKVNGLLEHNQVYTEKEDFDFVRDYIISHCHNLK